MIGFWEHSKAYCATFTELPSKELKIIIKNIIALYYLQRLNIQECTLTDNFMWNKWQGTRAIREVN